MAKKILTLVVIWGWVVVLVVIGVYNSSSSGLTALPATDITTNSATLNGRVK